MSHSTRALPQGAVGLLIPRALQPGTAHDYAISRSTRERTDGAPEIEDAAFSQALHRLER